MTGRIRWGALSEQGARPDNEDRQLVLVGRDAAPLLALAIVADGMGGHNAGDIAAGVAVEGFRRALVEWREIGRAQVEESSVREFLAAAVTRVNREILDRSTTSPELKGMGSTLVAAAVLPGGQLMVVHMGDSRAYLVRGEQVVQLTRDHSALAEKLRELGAAEQDLPEGVARAFGHWLTRSLGQEEEDAPDISETIPLVEGDRLLLVTDGISDVIGEQELHGSCAQGDLQACCERLVDRALVKGSEDNLTAVLLGWGRTAVHGNAAGMARWIRWSAVVGRNRRWLVVGLATGVVALLLGVLVLLVVVWPRQLPIAEADGLQLLAVGKGGAVVRVAGPSGADDEQVVLEVWDGAGRLMGRQGIPAGLAFELTALRQAAESGGADAPARVVVCRGGARVSLPLDGLPARDASSQRGPRVRGSPGSAVGGGPSDLSAIPGRRPVQVFVPSGFGSPSGAPDAAGLTAEDDLGVGDAVGEGDLGDSYSTGAQAPRVAQVRLEEAGSGVFKLGVDLREPVFDRTRHRLWVGVTRGTEDVAYWQRVERVRVRGRRLSIAPTVSSAFTAILGPGDRLGVTVRIFEGEGDEVSSFRGEVTVPGGPG